MKFYNHILILPASFIFSFFLSRLIILLCNRYSILDNPGKHKRHKKPTPNLGGTAILISIWLGLGLYLLIYDNAFEGIKGALPNIFAGSIVIYLVGLVDDLKPISAWIKLLTQVIAGLTLYFGGLSIDVISLPGYGSMSLNGFSLIITVFWVVALSNAVNLIDGLDGLAAGVSIIASASMAVIGFLMGIESVFAISLAIGGALLAFWLFNRYPARIFLGDCGSLLIGYFFAVLSLVVPIKSFTTAALFLPLVVLGVPLTETISSFMRRLVAGKNVMKADRRHIFHYLSYAGLTQQQIVYLFYFSGLAFGSLSVAMVLYYRVLVLTILILFMVVIFLIYFIFIGRMRKKMENKSW